MYKTTFCLFCLTLSLSQLSLAHPGASSSIDHFTHAIEHNPEDQALYMQRGIAYSNDGRFDEALADFEQAKKLGEPVIVSFDLGVLHYRRNEPEIARSYFDEYLAVFPKHLGSLEYRARLLRDMGEHDASVTAFKKLFEVQKQPNPGHYISVAKMLTAKGEAGIQEALIILDEGAEKIGLTPQLQQYAIELELMRERPDLALARSATLQPMLGKSPEYQVKQAEIYLKVGEKKRAMKLLKRAANQLEELRITPARQKLRQRITELRGN